MSERPDYDAPSVFLVDRFVGVVTAGLLAALAVAVRAGDAWWFGGGCTLAVFVLFGLGFYYPRADRPRRWWSR